MFHDRTAEFQAIVKKIKEADHLEATRLKSRLLRVKEKLCMDIAEGNLPSDGFTRREQVIPWLEDRLATNCYVCKKQFHRILRRKHHCRTCGEVICDQCSFFQNLSGITNRGVLELNKIEEPDDRTMPNDKKHQANLLQTRICRICLEKLGTPNNQYVDEPDRDDYLSLYESIAQIRKKIDQLWPHVSGLLSELSATNPHLSLQTSRKSWEDAIKLKVILNQHLVELKFHVSQLEQNRENDQVVSQKNIIKRNIINALNHYIKTKICYLELIPKHLPTHSHLVAPEISTSHEFLEDKRWNRVRQERLDVYRQQLKFLETSFQEATKSDRKDDAASLLRALQELKSQIEILQNLM